MSKVYKVVYDVDDVLNNLNDYVFDTVLKLPKPSRFKIAHCDEYTVEQKKQIIDMYSNPNTFRGLSYYPGASSITRIEYTGRALVYINSANYNEQIAEVKRESLFANIRNLSPDRVRLQVGTGDGKDITEEADIIIEDNILNLLKYTNPNVVRILINRTHNQSEVYGIKDEDYNIHRVDSLKEAKELVYKIVMEDAPYKIYWDNPIITDQLTRIGASGLKSRGVYTYREFLDYTNTRGSFPAHNRDIPCVVAEMVGHILNKKELKLLFDVVETGTMYSDTTDSHIRLMNKLVFLDKYKLNEIRLRLHKVIKALKPECRAVIEDYYFNDLNTDSIRKKLKISASAVITYKSNTLKAFKTPGIISYILCDSEEFNGNNLYFLGLPTRVVNTLYKHEIYTLEDLNKFLENTYGIKDKVDRLVTLDGIAAPKAEEVVRLLYRLNDKVSTNKIVEENYSIPKIYKNGVFLARMQPLHEAHMFLIEQALKECENVWVVLGSANKKNMLRNPFTLKFRREMLVTALSERGYAHKDIERIHIFELPDWSLENDTNETVTWGRYFYYNVVSRIESKNFTLYYSDNSEIVKSWFNSEVGEHITLRLFDRSEVYEGLSATKIRQAILDDDKEYLSRFCPPVIIRNLYYIKDYYRSVLMNPDEDFSMQ